MVHLHCRDAIRKWVNLKMNIAIQNLRTMEEVAQVYNLYFMDLISPDT